MLLLKIFFVFFKIGLFAIGGAYAFLPLIEKEVVEKSHWLVKEEFLDILGMVRIFPGAISVKFATYTGYKIAGIPGAVVANLGNILAPSILILVATNFYFKYKDAAPVKNAFNVVQLVIFAMIIAVAFKLIDPVKFTHAGNILIVIISFVLFVYTKIHPALIIIAAGILGVAMK